MPMTLPASWFTFARQMGGVDAEVYLRENWFMNVKSAARAVDLIEIFAESKRPLSVSELARLLSIPMSSCHGILRTLEDRGWLYELTPRGGYYVTRRLLDMAQVISAHDPLAERVAPVVRALRERTGETVVFGILQDGRVLFLLVEESARGVRLGAKAGEWRDAHSNSIGKAVLGAMPPEERAAVLASLNFTRHTPATLCSAQELEADLARSRSRGWYANIGESVPEVMGVGMPVMAACGRYGLTVAGPIQRIKAELRSIVTALQEAVATLSALE